MRITTKMMNNNSLYNINMNKTKLDKLNNQLAAEKKITRPSEDPVVAIRALKLRSNASELKQYSKRNTEDAYAWMDATAGAIDNTAEILTAMKAELTSGATGTNTTASRSAILTELKALKDQIYENGNVDYAGRNIFTGYRSNTNLTFSDADLYNHKVKYESINEPMDASNVSTKTLVYGDDRTVFDETKLGAIQVGSIRLAYDEIDKDSVSIDFAGASSVVQMNSAEFETLMKGFTDEATADAYFDANTVVVYDTGDIYFGDTVLNDIKLNKSAANSMNVTYDKSKWSAGDLRPEHYFDCTDVTDAANPVIYEDDHEQAIIIDLSENQSMQVNTYASDVFLHSIGRDVDEVMHMIEEVNEAAERVSKLELSLPASKDEYDAAQKKYSILNDKLQRTFESKLTSFTTYIDKVTLAGTTVGTRMSRLELVKNRLDDLVLTADELTSKNEDANLTDLAIDVEEASTTYQAALMATGQISQSTLMSYI